MSKTDAWAVGYTYTDDGNYIPDRAVIEHWNGRKWSVVPCPHSGKTYDMLTAVDASPLMTCGPSAPLATTPNASRATGSCSTSTAPDGPGTTVSPVPPGSPSSRSKSSLGLDQDHRRGRDVGDRARREHLP